MSGVNRRSVLLAGAATAATAGLTAPVAIKAADVKAALASPAEKALEADSALLQAIDRVNACRMAYEEANRAHDAASAALPAWVREGLDAGLLNLSDDRAKQVWEAFEDSPAKTALRRLDEAGTALFHAECEVIQIPARTLYGLYAKVALVIVPATEQGDDPDDNPFAPEALVRTIRDDVERQFFAAGRSA